MLGKFRGCADRARAYLSQQYRVVAVVSAVLFVVLAILVQAKEDAAQSVLLAALRKGIYFSTIGIALFRLLYVLIFPELGVGYLGIWGAMFVGLVAGNGIAYARE